MNVLTSPRRQINCQCYTDIFNLTHPWSEKLEEDGLSVCDSIVVFGSELQGGSGSGGSRKGKEEDGLFHHGCCLFTFYVLAFFVRWRCLDLGSCFGCVGKDFTFHVESSHLPTARSHPPFTFATTTTHPIPVTTLSSRLASTHHVATHKQEKETP